MYLSRKKWNFQFKLKHNASQGWSNRKAHVDATKISLRIRKKQGCPFNEDPKEMAGWVPAKRFLWTIPEILRYSDKILQCFQETSEQSIRRVGYQSQVSYSLLRLHQKLAKHRAYKSQVVQSLLSQDLNARVNFATKILDRISDDPQLIKLSIFSDETVFSRRRGSESAEHETMVQEKSWMENLGLALQFKSCGLGSNGVPCRNW